MRRRSLRARLTWLVTAAVAVAVVAATMLAWWGLRHTMLGQLDARLVARAEQMSRVAALTAVFPETAGGQFRIFAQAQDGPVSFQVAAPDGRVVRELTVDELRDALQTGGVELPVLVDGQPRLDTLTIGAGRYRVATVPLDEGGLIRLFQPMDATEATLRATATHLAGASLAGVGLAAVVGWHVARAGLRPVDRLVAETEAVARAGDVSLRVGGTSGRAHHEVVLVAQAVNSLLTALERSRDDQRELVENTAHELRTPLTVLRNDFGLLRRAGEALTPAERAEVVDDLDMQVEALSEAVTELVDLARGEEAEPALAELDVAAVIHDAVARVRGVAPGVTVRCHGPEPLPATGAVSLGRAVSNLVRNALQVSAPGQQVDVRWRHEAGTADPAGRGRVVVEVLDRGPGLDPEEIPRLFDRFFRGAAARERHGSGLGLAIVAQAAAHLGGSASAVNRDGGGACFTLCWPA